MGSRRDAFGISGIGTRTGVSGKRGKCKKAIRFKELELEEAHIKASQIFTSKELDLARNSRLVPPF